ncbi:sensor histidine kinase [Rhodobacter maris]|uniref:histidine kinase n=1 Tax=Rhodobacter maris TaxID=446682 RepID=A0A285RNU9_9RHOB|nr:CHASE4 domain-containing protein [Rhodobacter maris]SOB93987.1 signal transduction histidine kinase [Rhodobacter maris]
MTGDRSAATSSRRWHWRGWRGGNLRAALLADLALAGLLATLMIAAVLTVIVQHSIGTLERAEVARSIERVQAALATERIGTEAHARDWAIWDESYDYLRGFDHGFEQRNLNDDSLRNAEISCAAFVRFDGRGAHALCYDFATEVEGIEDEAEEELVDPDLTAAFMARLREPGVIETAQAGPSNSGFWAVGGQLYSLAFAKVLRSDGSGDENGFLAFAHLITPEHVSEALQMKAHFVFDGVSDLSHEHAQKDWLLVSTPVNGRAGQPIAMVHFEMPRSLLHAGQQLRNLLIAVLIALIAASMTLLGRRLSTHVIGPIQALQTHVADNRASGVLTPFTGPPRRDEIGALLAEFNAMAREIEELRTAHAAQSFALGREQSMIGLLHNLRNSLSPVKVIFATLGTRLDTGLPPQAARALAELADPQTAPERRRRLADFLTLAHEEEAQARAELRQMVADGARNLTEALEMIRATRDPAPPDQAERCDLAPLLAHAATVARFADGAQVAVMVDCPDGVTVRGNRVLLGQVFENLVVNATEAITAAGRGSGRIEIVVTPEPEARRCLVRIFDDGDGFDTEGAKRLFERGFSTRSQKRGGMGLHWCANTLTAMGGRLELTSPGAGQGALARVSLPLLSAGTSRERH